MRRRTRSTAGLNDKLRELDHLVSNIGALASSLTNYPAMAIAAAPPATISRFDLIYIDANTFIIVVMMSNNTVKNKLVRLPVSVGQDMIQRLASFFNANFTGVTEDRITPLTIRACERAVDDTMGLTGVIASFAIEVLCDAQTRRGRGVRREPAALATRVPRPGQGARPDELYFGR